MRSERGPSDREPGGVRVLLQPYRPAHCGFVGDGFRYKSNKVQTLCTTFTLNAGDTKIPLYKEDFGSQTLEFYVNDKPQTG